MTRRRDEANAVARKVLAQEIRDNFAGHGVKARRPLWSKLGIVEATIAFSYRVQLRPLTISFTTSRQLHMMPTGRKQA